MTGVSVQPTRKEARDPSARRREPSRGGWSATRAGNQFYVEAPARLAGRAEQLTVLHTPADVVTTIVRRAAADAGFGHRVHTGEICHEGYA
jgi:hypothetical protein